MANKKYPNEWQRKKAERAVLNASKKRCYTAFTLRFHKKSDADIIEKLTSVPNRLGYLRELIRKDINNE